MVVWVEGVNLDFGFSFLFGRSLGDSVFVFSFRFLVRNLLLYDLGIYLFCVFLGLGRV